MGSIPPRMYGTHTPRTPAQQLHAALAAYGLNRRLLRRLASQPAADLRAALRDPNPPAELLALLDLQIALLTPTRRDVVRGPADVAALLMARMGHLDQEQLITICLNRCSGVADIALIYQGCVDSATIRLAEIFKPAIWHNSCSIILAHNHPSGVVEPSQHDIEITYDCIQMGKQLGIAIADHLIVGAGCWLSLWAWMKERGITRQKRDAA